MRKFLVLYMSPVSAEEQMQNASPEDMQKGMEPWPTNCATSLLKS